MSNIYSVGAKLKTEYSREIVSALLNKAFQKKLIFFDQDFEVGKWYNSQILNLEGAVNKILIDSEQNKKFGKAIFVKFEDTRFSLRFYIDEFQSLQIWISDITTIWTQNYDNSGRDVSYVDFARYLRLLLLICEDFLITEIYTEVLD